MRRYRLLLHRALLTVGALLAFAAAAGLIITTGLPDPALYSRLLLPGETRPAAPELNAPAPPFALRTLSGEVLQLTALRGQPVVLNFWATWCEPCRHEMPALQALYAAENEHFRLIAVNLGEPAAAVQAWVHEFGLTFDVLLDENEQLFALYRLRGVPSTFIIAPDGVITHIYFGPVTAAALQAALSPYRDTSQSTTTASANSSIRRE